MRILLIPLFLLFVLGCRKSPNENRENIVIGFSQCASDEWRLNMDNEIRRESALYRDPAVEVNILNSKGDVDLQIAQIRELFESGVDLMMVSPGESERLTAIIAEVYEAGVPVIIIDRKINSTDFTAYIGADNGEIGKAIGNYVGEILDWKGSVLEVTGELVSSPYSERSRGFRTAIKDSKDDIVHTSIEIEALLEKAAGDPDAIPGMFEGVDLIYAHSDPIAFEVHQILNRYHIPSPPMVGIDGLIGDNNGIEMVIQGKLNATFLYPTGGDKAIQLAMEIVNGGSYEKYSYLNSLKIDRGNVFGIKNQFLELRELQEKIDIQREVTSSLNFLVERQKSSLVLLSVAIVLLVIIVVLIINSLGKKIKTNRLLDNKNKIIKAKNDKILSQKNNLTRVMKIAEEATEMKLRFLSTISHELRNSVNLISLSMEDLKQDNNDQDQNSLVLIAKSTERLKLLSDEILTLKKFDNKSFKANPISGNLSELVHNVVTILAPQAKNKDIKLVSKIKPDLVFDFDPAMIEKVVFNLVSNAIKFTGENGSINIKLFERDSKVYLKVRDNGIGMDAQEASRIFNPYYSVGKQISENTGFGYGLAICKELVQLHGGKISVESAKHLGTTFTVKIPKKRVVEEMTETISIPEEPTNGFIGIDAKSKVLLVEDNRELLNLLSKILESRFQVIQAYDGKNGLELALAHLPDIVVSDVLMPRMSGIEFCQELKANPRTAHIPFVLLTAISSEDTKIDSFDIGVDDYLTKPINAKILISRIKNLIQTRVNVIKSLGEGYSILNQINSENNTDKEFVERLIAIVEENIANEDLNVKRISEQMNMSYSALYRKLKTISNIRLVDLIKKIRLHHAAKQLITTNLKINEIALGSGFSDTKYFRKCFKKEFDDYPSNFRKKTAVEA